MSDSPEPILTEADYERALARVEQLMDEVGPEGASEELKALAILVDEYEEQYCPIPKVSNLSVLQFVMDDRGIKPKDLKPFIGALATVRRVLNGSEELSLAMIQALCAGLDIPISMFSH